MGILSSGSGRLFSASSSPDRGIFLQRLFGLPDGSRNHFFGFHLLLQQLEYGWIHQPGCLRLHRISEQRELRRRIGSGVRGIGFLAEWFFYPDCQCGQRDYSWNEHFRYYYYCYYFQCFDFEHGRLTFHDRWIASHFGSSRTDFRGLGVDVTLHFVHRSNFDVHLVHWSDLDV